MGKMDEDGVGAFVALLRRGGRQAGRVEVVGDVAVCATHLPVLLARGRRRPPCPWRAGLASLLGKEGQVRFFLLHFFVISCFLISDICFDLFWLQP